MRAQGSDLELKEFPTAWRDVLPRGDRALGRGRLRVRAGAMACRAGGRVAGAPQAGTAPGLVMLPRGKRSAWRTHFRTRTPRVLKLRRVPGVLLPPWASPTWRWPMGAPMRPPMVNSHGSNGAGISTRPSRSDQDVASPRVCVSPCTGTINPRLIERVHARALIMLASWASEGGPARADRRVHATGASLFSRRSAQRLRGD